MSAVEAPARRSPLVTTRLLRSELRLVFGRRRNQVILATLAAIPILVAVAVKLFDSDGGGGAGGPGPGGFIASITQNGLFVSLVALGAVTPLFLPLAIAVVSGDAVAGEANQGTLRYLLTVPVHRTRLLAVKFAAIVAYAIACTVVVGAVGAAVGLALFPAGEVTLLSGGTVSTAAASVRILLVCGYLALCMSALGAVGLFISTLTDYPVAAMAATAVVPVLSQVLDVIPQVSAIHPWLISHWWYSFGEFLSDPIILDQSYTGILSAIGYMALFVSMAWAYFSGKDVAS